MIVERIVKGKYMKKIEKKQKYNELYEKLSNINYKICAICLVMSLGFRALEMMKLNEQSLILLLFFIELQVLRELRWEYAWAEEYYFSDQLKKSRVCERVLYRNNEILADNGMVINVWILIICFCVSTLLLWMGCILGKYIEYIPAGIMFLGGAIDVCVFFIRLFHVAHKKFRRLTWKNCRYYIGCIKKNEELPEQHKIGGCEIVKSSRRCFRTYYTARMVNTKEIYTKVIYCGKEKINTEFTYCLYEICGTKYIQ